MGEGQGTLGSRRGWKVSLGPRLSLWLLYPCHLCPAPSFRIRELGTRAAAGAGAGAGAPLFPKLRAVPSIRLARGVAVHHTVMALLLHWQSQLSVNQLGR